METKTFPAFELEQNGKKFYLTFMRAEDLVENTTADIFDPKTKKGYQRRINTGRAREFAAFLTREHGISPTAIMLSYRDNKPLFESTNKDGHFGKLILKNQKLWQVDGQHRIAGLFELISTYPPYEYDKEMVFPAIIICPALWKDTDMNGILFEEALQFIIINKTQKGVNPALTEQFLPRLKEKLGGIKGVTKERLPKVITRGIEWKPEALHVAETLNSNSHVWNQKIRLANEEPRSGTLVEQKTFTDSLAPIFKSELLRTLPKDDLAEILERYWEAIRDLCPEAYTESTKYVLFRRLGLFVMHNILPDVMNYIKPGEKVTVERLIEILEAIPEIKSKEWGVDSDFGSRGTSFKAVSDIANALRDSLKQNYKQKVEKERFVL